MNRELTIYHKNKLVIELLQRFDNWLNEIKFPLNTSELYEYKNALEIVEMYVHDEGTIWTEFMYILRDTTSIYNKDSLYDYHLKSLIINLSRAIKKLSEKNNWLKSRW